MPQRLRIGVDIGGTFTDFTVIDDDGTVRLWKEDSTPDDPTRAIEAGLAAISASRGQSTHDLLGATSLFVHGTTIATNAVIEHKGPTLGLLATDGFRDVLYFRDGYKPERFNIHLAHPEPPVPRRLRLGARERVTPTGDVLIGLEESDVRRAAETFRSAGVTSIAVAFLWSFMHPEHEQRAGRILQEELPDAHVLLSSNVLPEIGEWERTSATALSAFVLPAIAEYLHRLETLLDEGGLERPMLIMQSNGGCTSVSDLLRRPVNAIASGPAAAPAAATFHAAQVGAEDLISIDMGGTSLDVCVIRGGRPAMSRNMRVDEQPVGVPGVEVHSIGAGGGSIAWVDPGGALRVGPESAGARPGPACYGLGGDRPTVTDANVVLGYLQPSAFLGGRRTLDADRAVEAIARGVGAPLGLEPTESALGILRVVDSNIMGAIRAVSIERGIDPRDFTLISGGGAGGLHAGRLARALGTARVLVPREAGTLCAFGMTVTDVRHDHARAYHATTSDLDIAHLRALLEELEMHARSQLKADGFDPSVIDIERSVDARYPGQIHEITVPLPDPDDADFISSLERIFHEEHDRRYTYSRPNVPIEALHWRISAFARVGTRPAPIGEAPATTVDDGRIGETLAWFPGSTEPSETSLHAAERLKVGATIEGPAIVQAPTTTVLVNPGDRFRLVADDLYEMRIGAEPDAEVSGTHEVERSGSRG